MRRILIAAVSTAMGVANVAAAQEDSAPPGCRWWSDGVLACKDGQGHWRRSGDDQIVGTYPMAKPKPKPKPAAKASTAPAVVAPVAAAPVAAAPAAAPAPPPAGPTLANGDPPLPPLPAELQNLKKPPPPAAAEPAQEAPKPWWRRWLDSLWNSIKAYLRLFGIGK